MTDNLQQIVEFDPAYDKRDPDPKKNYGIDGVTLKMVLKGPAGAVQFVVFTNWNLPHVQKETDKRLIERISRATRPKRYVAKVRGVAPEKMAAMLDAVEKRVIPYEDGEQEVCLFYHPMPADLGYHSPRPMYEGQLPMGAEKLDFEHKETLQGATGSIEIPTRIKTGTFDPCPWLDGRPCYYDGSSLQAEPVFEVLLREGSAGVWRELRKYYNETFGEQEA